MALPDHPFWNFSLAIYGRPAVADACLRLQGRHGVDVNLLLYCLWIASVGTPPLTAAEMAALKATASPWNQHVIWPLRGVRDWLKDRKTGKDALDARGVSDARQNMAADFRKTVLAIELEAEHIEQLLLASAGPAPFADKPGTCPIADAASHGAANLALFLQGMSLDATDIGDLRVLLEEAFPGAGGLSSLSASIAGAAEKP